MRQDLLEFNELIFEYSLSVLWWALTKLKKWKSIKFFLQPDWKQFWVFNPTSPLWCQLINSKSGLFTLTSLQKHQKNVYFTHICDFSPSNLIRIFLFQTQQCQRIHLCVSKSLWCKFGHHFAIMQTHSSWLNKGLCPNFFFLIATFSIGVRWFLDHA